MIKGFPRLSSKFNLPFGKFKIPFGISTWTTGISLFFISNLLIKNIHQLKDIRLSNDLYIFLSFALLFGVISIYFNAVAWKNLLYWVGYEEIDLTNVIKVYLRTNLLKYLPGGIWHFVARIKALRLINESYDAIKAVILEPLLMLTSAMILVPLGDFKSGLSLLFFLPALLFFKRSIEPLIEILKALKYTKLAKLNNNPNDHSSDQEKLKIRSEFPLVSLMIEVLFILFRYISFYLCLFSFQPDIHFIKLLSAFSFSWAIGLVVPAAPGGIGIFESALIIQVGDSFPKAIFISVLLLYRIIITLSDLIAAALFTSKIKTINISDI